MENINIYIQEKLKITSKTKIISKSIQEEYCIAIAYDDLYDELCEYFEDDLVGSEHNLNCFIIEPYKIKSYWDSPDLYLLKIPDYYNNLDDLIKEYETGKLNCNNLQDFNLKKYIKDNNL